jgi:hypothetical protein
MYVYNIKTYGGNSMRIGINVPNELIERFKPLKSTHNISEICRDALKNYIESYETASQGTGGDEMTAIANRLYQEYNQKTPRVDWEAIGRGNAKKWAEGASLQDFDDVIHNITIHKRKGAEPGEFLGSWRIPEGCRFEDAQRKHEDWFERQFELDERPNYYMLAKQNYSKGWVSYLTAVWQMVRSRIKDDDVTWERARQQSKPNPEIPANLANTRDKPDPINNSNGLLS